MIRSQKEFCAFLSFFLLTLQSALAQTADSTFFHSLSVGWRVHYGTLTGDEAKLQYVEDRHTFLGEVDIMSQTTGSRSWQEPSNFPRIGLALIYGQSGASVYVGHLAAILPFIDFHLYSSREAVTNLRIGVGPAWVQKTFNAETNYQNLVIGSHLNACLSIMLTEEIRLFPRGWLDLGFSFTHISNGSFTLPNLGLNTPALTAGLRYGLFPEQKRRQRPMAPAKKKINYYFYSFVAGKQSLPLESAVYLVNVFNLEAMKDFSRTGRFGGGINMTLDRANSIEVPNSRVFAWDRSLSHWQAAIYGQYEYVVGDLSFPLQVGYYLYNKYPINSIYQTYGVKYRFAPRWTAAFALKAHLGNGDFIQWGLGYKF